VGPAPVAQLRLHLGCGEHRLDGWLNLDRRSLPGVVPVDLPDDLVRLPDGRARYIYAAHLFEHVDYPDSALELARHCHRLLTPGGILRIVVPGIERIIQAYVADDTAFFQRQAELHPPSCRTKLDHLMYALQGDGHRYGYDFETLDRLLRLAGFVNVVLSDYQGSATAELRVDYRGEGLSLFVEATR
jgi:predicted SAM-dependent methyltransferase